MTNYNIYSQSRNVRNLKTTLKSKILILTFIYIIAIPLSNMSQTSYWIVLILSPFLFFKKSSLNNFGNKKKYLNALFLTLIVVAFTGLISFNYLWPLKRSIMLFSIWLASFFLIKKLSKLKNIIAVLKGIIIASITYSILLFIEANFSGYSLSFAENSYLGKNSSSPFILLGMFSSMLVFSIAGEHKKYLLTTFYFFIIILMITAIKMIITSIFVLFVFFLLGYKSIKSRIKFSVFSILLVFCFSFILYTKTNIKETQEFKITTSRIIALFGGTPEIAYTVNVTVQRENLIQSGWEIFLENKLLGIGLENTRHILGTYTHNTIIELLAGGGIFAAFFFLLAFYYVFKEIFKIKDFNLRVLLFTMLLTLLLVGQAQRLYDNQIIMFFVTLIIILPEKINRP